MAITATRTSPPSPEMMPGPGGRITEVWQLTGDGSATTYALTTDFIDYVEYALPGANDIAPTTQKTFTVTFTTAPANGATHHILVVGRKN